MINDWEPQEPFDKDTLNTLVDEHDEIVKKSMYPPDILGQASDGRKYKLWDAIHLVFKMRHTLIVNNVLFYELSVFYKYFYHYQCLNKLTYIEQFVYIDKKKKKNTTLIDLKHNLISAHYDCSSEMLYRNMYKNPNKSVKELLKAHHDEILRLTNMIYEKPDIDQILDRFGDENELFCKYACFDLDMRLRQSKFDLSLLVFTMKFITKWYINICIAIKSLNLPHYVVLWIFDCLDYDVEYIYKNREDIGNSSMFQGFDIKRRTKDLKKMYIFDFLSHLQKIRIIENIQTFHDN